jgi:hypothetical protein
MKEKISDIIILIAIAFALAGLIFITTGNGDKSIICNILGIGCIGTYIILNQNKK